MSEFERDPSASTGRFRAFVERGDQDIQPARRFPVSGVVLAVTGVVVILVIVILVATV
jgi:hypothetical protein